MKDSKIPWQDDDLLNDSFYDVDMVASATEYTGLIPSLPLSEDEVEAYADIYTMPYDE